MKRCRLLMHARSNVRRLHVQLCFVRTARLLAHLGLHGRDAQLLLCSAEKLRVEMKCPLCTALPPPPGQRQTKNCASCSVAESFMQRASSTLHLALADDSRSLKTTSGVISAATEGTSQAAKALGVTTERFVTLQQATLECHHCLRVTRVWGLSFFWMASESRAFRRLFLLDDSSCPPSPVARSPVACQGRSWLCL